MADAVAYGTAQRAQVAGLTIAGKTGSARQRGVVRRFHPDARHRGAGAGSLRRRGCGARRRPHSRSARMRAPLAVFWRSAACAALHGAPGTLKVRLKPGVSGATIEMPLEKYVAAVLAGESSTFSSDEAMKAMAVAARTLRRALPHAPRQAGLRPLRHHALPAARARTGHRRACNRSPNRPTGELLWYEGKPAYACLLAQLRRHDGGFARPCGTVCTCPSCAPTPTLTASVPRRADGSGAWMPETHRGGTEARQPAGARRL